MANLTKKQAQESNPVDAVRVAITRDCFQFHRRHGHQHSEAEIRQFLTDVWQAHAAEAVNRAMDAISEEWPA